MWTFDYWPLARAPRATAVVLLPVGLSLILAVAAFTAAPIQNTVTLPIEVIGPDGYTKSVTVEASDVSQVDSLYLRAYSIGYPYWERYDVAKASIRINGAEGGAWTDLTNSVATCKYPESRFACISGPYHTIRFEVAVSDISGSLVDGSNTIDFRFNYAFPEDSPDDFGDPSTGYRILGVELRGPGDSDAIDGTSFTWDDPSTWGAPDGYDSSESIARGKELWNQRNVLTEHWGSDNTITAACSDCHASDGRDLSYFAFSNWSIIARSEFHGLTESQGKEIAAYIRSLQLKDVDDGHTYDPPGRPWHPPYQPGPTSVASRDEAAPRTSGTRITEMPSGGSQYAAAGAGVEWALDHDREMLDHVFPGGPSADDFDIDSARDGLHVPLPLQFPDWNEWLPVHHPLDMWGTQIKTWEERRSGWWDPVEGPPGGQNASASDYRECAKANGADDSGCLGTLGQWIKLAGMEADNFEDKEWDFVQSGYTDVTNQSDHAYRHTQLEKWITVRQWQVIDNYDAADDMAGANAFQNVDRYQWTGGKFPFDMAPHVSGEYAGSKFESWDLWLDNVWYELAVRMNSGRGHKLGNRPVDWQYQHGHVTDLWHLGISQPLRLTFSVMKAFEVCESHEDGNYSEGGTPRAWSINRRICGPILGEYHDTFAILDSYQSGLHREMFEVVFGEQVEAMMYRHSPDLGENVDQNWERIENSRKGWEPAATTTVDTSPGDLNSSFWFDRSEEPTHFYHILSLGNQIGVRPTLLDSAAAWNDAMVPDPAWDDFRCSENGGSLDCTVSAVSQRIQLQSGWNFVSSRVTPENPSVSQVFAGVDGLSVVKTEDGRAYIPSLDIDRIGTWSSSKGYKVHVKSNQEVTLTGSPVDASTPLQLEEGWNLIPFYPNSPMDATVAFGPIEDAVRVVRDEEGRTYVPSQENDIGDLMPGDGYVVNVSRDTTFVYPVESN